MGYLPLPPTLPDPSEDPQLLPDKILDHTGHTIIAVKREDGNWRGPIKPVLLSNGDMLVGGGGRVTVYHPTNPPTYTEYENIVELQAHLAAAHQNKQLPKLRGDAVEPEPNLKRQIIMLLFFWAVLFLALFVSGPCVPKS